MCRDPLERIRHIHRNICTDTHYYVQVQTLTDAKSQENIHHLIRNPGGGYAGQAWAHQLSKSVSTGEQHEKTRMRSCSLEDV